jgi:hypothetical protein
MKWLFVTIILVAELLSVYLLQNSFWGVLIIFISGMVGALVAKITNENNSTTQNQIAFGLFFGTIFTIIFLALYIVYLMSRMP